MLFSCNTFKHPLAEAEKATKRAAERAQQLLTFAKGGGALTLIRIKWILSEANPYSPATGTYSKVTLKNEG